MNVTMKLGALIEALEKQPPGNDVAFDFFRLPTDRIDSYRGYYDHLAIGFGKSDQARFPVLDLIRKLKACDGQTFLGYKGGSYTMSLSTPVWVGNWGECENTGIVGVEFDPLDSSITLLKTAHCE